MTVAHPEATSLQATSIRACLGIMLVCLPISACNAKSSKPQQVDLTWATTWLGPDEAANGRKLTIAGHSGLYITTSRGCVIASGNLANPVKQIAPDMIDLTALIDGAIKNGRRVPPHFRLVGVINDHAKVYTIDHAPQIALLSEHSLRCLTELGQMKATPDELRKSPDRIEIHLNQTAALPNVPLDWMNGVAVSAYGLIDKRQRRRYCRIAVGTKGRFIEKVRIDVLGTQTEIPSITDYHAMDCIMRGVISSYGYTGILGHDVHEIYPPSQLINPSLSKGHYAITLLESFSKFTQNISNRMPK